MADMSSSQLRSLKIPEALVLQVTPEQFAMLAASNRELQLERTSRGNLLINPPTGWETGQRNWSIAGELYLWWRNAGEPGMAFDSSTGFRLPNGAILSPDASWVNEARWTELAAMERETFAPVCLDFVVELRSRSDSLRVLREKMREYQANGARLGWLIDPPGRSVEVFREDGSVKVLVNPESISAEGMLVGFVLSLARIWG